MIQLKNVSKYYYSKGMIASGISRVNLEFDIGEFVVITGESGSGKTTLLNVISGLDSYEEGEMYIDGRETSHFLSSDFEEYRKKYIGNILQDFNLVNSYTVYQNIELILLINGYKKDEIRRRVHQIIKLVGMEPYTRTKVSKLSGGQKQRVAIARALAKNTDIIVADEPTGNLDSESAEGIVRLLSEISRDRLVIVVTHNYDQFASYATRKIKMHDGSVAEDVRLSERNRSENKDIYFDERPLDDNKITDRDITAGSRIRLGVRNTFNILPKFILLLVVFLFVVAAVTSQYTTLRNQEAEEDKLGFNDYFYNYSEDRVVLKKKDGSAFTADDFKAIGNVQNIRTVSPNDILLDSALYIDSEDYSYEVYPRTVGEFGGTLEKGRMPENDNEVIITAVRGYSDDSMLDELLDKNFRISIGEDKELNVTVVGFGYKDQDDGSLVYAGDLYVTDQMMSDMLRETYNYESTVKVTINGKEQHYQQGDSFYRIVPNSRVSQGSAIGSEELNNFYDNGDAEGKTITVTAENIFYSQSVDLKLSDIYDKKSFREKTGVSDYESNNGTIYISQSDYDTLFNKGNFQVTVYVKDTDAIKDTLGALENMGYITLPLKDTLINIFSDFTSIIKVPMAVILVVALFFIAYFVIRLILRSRASYFSILRMLGMARKNIKRILDVEMLLIVNIAYAIFIAFIVMVNVGAVKAEYITGLIKYMDIYDYVILYVVIIFMAYLISGKFARSLFRKTAIGTYREEER